MFLHTQDENEYLTESKHVLHELITYQLNIISY